MSPVKIFKFNKKRSTLDDELLEVIIYLINYQLIRFLLTSSWTSVAIVKGGLLILKTKLKHLIETIT